MHFSLMMLYRKRRAKKRGELFEAIFLAHHKIYARIIHTCGIAAAVQIFYDADGAKLCSDEGVRAYIFGNCKGICAIRIKMMGKLGFSYKVFFLVLVLPFQMRHVFFVKNFIFLY